MRMDLEDYYQHITRFSGNELTITELCVAAKVAIPQYMHELVQFLGESKCEFFVDVVDIDPEEIVSYCYSNFKDRCIAIPSMADIRNGVLLFFKEETDVTMFCLRFSKVPVTKIQVFNR